MCVTLCVWVCVLCVCGAVVVECRYNRPWAGTIKGLFSEAARFPDRPLGRFEVQANVPNHIAFFLWAFPALASTLPEEAAAAGGCHSCHATQASAGGAVAVVEGVRIVGEAPHVQ